MNKFKQWSKENIYYILAFSLPVLIAIIAFIAQGVWPFGDRGISVIDSYHQYVPFFSELQYKLKNWDSLLYSWHGGLGMNFFAVIAYYLASPLNLLLIIFPKSLVMECFTLIYLLKVGLAGFSFAYYLHRRFERYDFSITVFGCMYALSSFLIGYGWNIMWLDCIVLFPMVMLGIYVLVHKGKGWIYGVSLAFCIFTNYYIAFMICIFSCIFILVELFLKSEWTVRKFIYRLLKFAGYSLSAGGFAAVMILPTAYALGASASASSSFPTTLKFYHSTFDLLCQHFAFIKPTDLSGNFNLYCGAAILVFVPMFLLNREIPLTDRVMKMSVAAFLLVCLNTNYLTYIWHGFHFPNGLPGRYSFIYIFMLLIMGYEGISKNQGCPKWLPSTVAGIWLVFMAYCCWGEKIDFENYTLIINIIVLFIYGVLISAVCLKLKRWKIFERLLLIVVLVEACSYGIFGLCMNGTVNRKDYYSDQTSVRMIKEITDEKEEDNFYRIELEERRGRDDITWHNLPGASLFSSTVNAGVNNIVKRLGYYSVTNKYSYEGATPETDAFFNIQYLISRDKKESIRRFDYIMTQDDRYLYENIDALGLGFMVSQNILQWDYEKTNPFESINQFMTSVMGEETRPYTYFGFPQPVSDDCVLTTDSWADWSYSAANKEDGTVTYTYYPEKSQDLYIYFKASHCDKVTVELNKNSKSYSDEDGHIIQVGYVQPGDLVTLIFDMDAAYDSGTIKLIAAEHDTLIYDHVIKKMKQSTWSIESYDSTHLSGMIETLDTGIMFTSVPYETGWVIKVDGKTIESLIIGNAFIGIPLSEGVHHIEMNYVSEGFWPGLVITIVCACILFAVFCVETDVGTKIKLRRNTKKN